jgi:hypothetical protein
VNFSLLKHEVGRLSDGIANADNPEQAASDLNAKLRKTNLICNEGNKCSKDVMHGHWSFLGFLNEFKIRRTGPFLFVLTSIGEECGYAEAVYAYAQDESQWKRLFDTQVAGKKRDLPDYVMDISVEPATDQPSSAAYYILTDSHGDWCSSNWHDVQYQLHFVDLRKHFLTTMMDTDAYAMTGDMGSLKDGMEYGNFAKLSTHSLSLRFITSSINWRTAHTHPAILNYRLDGMNFHRVQPVAEDPEDFIEEWLISPWNVSSEWTQADHRSDLYRRYKSLQSFVKKRSGIESMDAGHNCDKESDLRQVEFTFGDKNKNPLTLYFLLRRDKPEEFMLMDITPSPRSDCDLPLLSPGNP